MFRFGTAFRGKVDKVERIQSNENDQKIKGERQKDLGLLSRKDKGRIRR